MLERFSCISFLFKLPFTNLVQPKLQERVLQLPVPGGITDESKIKRLKAAVCYITNH